MQPELLIPFQLVFHTFLLMKKCALVFIRVTGVSVSDVLWVYFIIFWTLCIPCPVLPGTLSLSLKICKDTQSMHWILISTVWRIIGCAQSLLFLFYPCNYFFSLNSISLSANSSTCDLNESRTMSRWLLSSSGRCRRWCLAPFQVTVRGGLQGQGQGPLLPSGKWKEIRPKTQSRRTSPIWKWVRI